MATRNTTTNRAVWTSLVARMNGAALALFPVLAVIALSLSLPRLFEGVLALPGDAALSDLQAGDGKPEAIDTAVHSRERALALIDRGEHHSQLAAALEIRGQFEQGEERTATLNRAVREAERGVTQSPADAAAWYQLAAVSFYRDGVNQRVVDAALSSIAVGPYENGLILPRLELLLASRIYISRQSDDVVDNQVRVAWRRDANGMIRMIRRTGTADIVRRALSRDPIMLPSDFDAILANPKNG